MMDDYDFWIYDPDGDPDTLKCPVCINIQRFRSRYEDVDSYRYCFWCGARLRIRKENTP